MTNEIDLNLFQVFVEVANERNITKASQNLYITQPAVTQAINRLEKSLGVKLFIRQNKGVLLTDYGKLIYEDISSGITQLKSAVANIKNLINNENAVLKIGCGANIAKWLINKPCKELMNKYSHIKIEIHDLKVDELINKLQNGDIDCFISYSNLATNKNITSFKVKSTTYCFVGGKKFEELSKHKNDISVLDNLPFVAPSGIPSHTGNYFKSLCEKYNINIDVKIEAGRFGTILEFVKDNIGIAFIPEYIAKEVCDSVNLFRIDVSIPLEAVNFDIYYNKNYQSNLLKELLNKL